MKFLLILNHPIIISIKDIFMEDAGCDTKNTIKILIDMDIAPLIWSNVGNTKEQNQ
jgi:hypothetical protein